MIKKNLLEKAIKNFPEEFTLEELVEKGNQDSLESITVSEAAFEEEMQK